MGRLGNKTPVSSPEAFPPEGASREKGKEISGSKTEDGSLCGLVQDDSPGVALAYRAAQKLSATHPPGWPPTCSVAIDTLSKHPVRVPSPALFLSPATCSARNSPSSTLVHTVATARPHYSRPGPSLSPTGLIHLIGLILSGRPSAEANQSLSLFFSCRQQERRRRKRDKKEERNQKNNSRNFSDFARGIR